ncbi:DASH complex subunit [Wickerhamomyces ciferrii]|uniref:DASH complex subunit SPC19 n=1 Tax=Wickerhamomyces ciferrii (strain ATCC 14091 / BCRC 22168 / CBS 111 / JCM 3599 / NBRC 0793 / NRRL Y-1031 F-60-10) TaxID=1206466 RepID=K0KFA1_WICCF|nr:DASH complex subunit [Wickerhamomyces ciferrii]CCH41626.1 DASH complex subunit [Wickerhamomyces ciferrii]
MSYSYANTLNGSISSLSASVSLLGNSLNSLDALSEDFERLPTVLKQSNIFTLIPETDLNDAKQHLVYELEPKIEALKDKVRLKISKLERKKSNLVSKIELNQVRINNFKNDEKAKKANQENVEIEGSEEELEKLRQLRLKKDRLKFKLSSVKLQHRKARLSMIPR